VSASSVRSARVSGVSSIISETSSTGVASASGGTLSAVSSTGLSSVWFLGVLLQEAIIKAVIINKITRKLDLFTEHSP
jgi:hypothetical protein